MPVFFDNLKNHSESASPTMPALSAWHRGSSKDGAGSLRRVSSHNADLIHVTDESVNYQARPYLWKREHLTTEHI